MPIDRFTRQMSCCDFQHYLFIFIQYSRKVHHLTQVQDFRSFQQQPDLIAVQFCPGCFKESRWYAAGSTEKEFERYPFAVFDHKLNAWGATNIGYFVWIADRGHCTVNYR